MLKYIINQTPETCLEVVKEDGLALQYIKNTNIRNLYGYCKTKWISIKIC